MGPLDFLGRELFVGQTVVRAVNGAGHNFGQLESLKVTRIEQGKVYLNDSARPMKYADRLAIVEG